MKQLVHDSNDRAPDPLWVGTEGRLSDSELPEVPEPWRFESWTVWATLRMDTSASIPEVPPLKALHLHPS